MRPAVLILFTVALVVPGVGAQVLYLQRLGDPVLEPVAAVGDTVEVEIRTDLQGFSAAGLRP